MNKEGAANAAPFVLSIFKLRGQGKDVSLFLVLACFFAPSMPDGCFPCLGFFRPLKRPYFVFFSCRDVFGSSSREKRGLQRWLSANCKFLQKVNYKNYKNKNLKIRTLLSFSICKITKKNVKLQKKKIINPL